MFRVSNKFNFVIRSACILTLLVGLSGCELLQLLDRSAKSTSRTSEPVPVASPRPKAIERPSDKEIRYAQAALTSLGYKLGATDGIWGPRSAGAIQQFEADQKLATANGRLSDLNLSRLKKLVGKQPKNTQAKAKKNRVKSIASKIDRSVPLSSAPQLIFVDRAYSLLSKPNPFSEPLSIIKTGTGIYIISVQDGWYQVQADNQQRGFIKEK